MTLWVEKYRPKHLDEIVGQEKAISEIRRWMSDLSKDKKVKPLLIVGPAGTGKTSAAYAIANDLGYALVEINCADLRDREKLEKVIGGLGSVSLLDNSPRIILLDEVDALPAEGRIISKLIDELLSRGVPVIMTANNPYEKHLYRIRAVSDVVNFSSLNQRSIIRVLSTILRKEGISLPESVLKAIASTSKGDLRAAINDLQAIAQGSPKLAESYGRTFGLRDKEIDIFRVLGSIFSGRNCARTRFLTSTLDMDPPMFLRWVEENIPVAIKTPKGISLAYECAASADIILSRIVRTGNWKLMVYAMELLTLGICAAKSAAAEKSRFIKFSFPEVIRKMAATKEERASMKLVSVKLAEKLHVSSSVVRREILPLIKALLRKDSDTLRKLSQELGLSEHELKDVVQGS